MLLNKFDLCNIKCISILNLYLKDKRRKINYFKMKCYFLLLFLPGLFWTWQWPVSSEHWCTSPTLVIIILCQNSLFPCLSIQLDQEQLQDGDNSFQLYVFFPWHRLWHAKGLSEWMMGWVPDECIRGRVKCQFLLSKSSWLASGGSFIYGTFQFHRLHVTMTLWPWGSAGRRRKGSPE
jgi:hypothetical protein